MSLLLGPYESGVRDWEERRHYVSGQLAGHAWSHQSYKALSELHDVAVKMESMLRGRRPARPGQARGDAGPARGHPPVVAGTGAQPEEAAVVPTLSQDRERLSTIFSSLAGSTVAVSALPDTGLLGDLREAREAIILAEALMELKGY